MCYILNKKFILKSQKEKRKEEYAQNIILIT